MAYTGFKKLKEQLAKKGAKNPGALASYIGKKKYGAKAMSQAAHSGKTMKTLGKAK